MESGFELAKIEFMDEQAQEDLNHGSKDIISFEEALERELEFQRSKKMKLLMPSIDTGSVPASASQSSVGSGFVSASPHGAERELNMRSTHPSVKAMPDCQKPFERGLDYRKSMEMRAKADCQKPFKRELEYRKSIEMRFMQPAVASGLVTAQELPSRSDVVGVKRKTDSLSYPQKRGIHDNSMLSERALRPRKNLDSEASLRQLQYHKRPSELSHLPRPQALPPKPKSDPVASQHFQSQCLPAQQLMYPQQVGTQQPSKKTIIEPLWCSLCEVQCASALCFQQHCEGKKHKAKQKEVSGCESDERKWCPQCKIWCMNEVSLAQHLIGKKHASRLVHGQVEVLTGKSDGIRWCPECKIWCMDEHALAQHRAGKKHAACLGSLMFQSIC